MKFSFCIQPFIGRGKASRRRQSPQPDVRCVSPSASVSTVSEERRRGGDGRVEVFPKGILKKPDGQETVVAGKGQVKWMDCMGKELFEIREFEPVSPPSPHLIELETKCKHRHLRRFSLFAQHISSTPPYPIAAVIPPEDPRTGSLVNLHDLHMSSCKTQSFDGFFQHPVSCVATPTFPQTDPLGGTFVSSQQPPSVATISSPKHSLRVRFIEPQIPPLAAETPSPGLLSSPSSGGIQLRWYQPLRRISSAPSSNRTYLQLYRALFRSKSTGS